MVRLEALALQLKIIMRLALMTFGDMSGKFLILQSCSRLETYSVPTYGLRDPP